MHQYIVRKHTVGGKQQKIILIAVNLQSAQLFVYNKVKEMNTDQNLQWNSDISPDLEFYSNDRDGICFSITGFDTGVEYEDL